MLADVQFVCVCVKTYLDSPWYRRSWQPPSIRPWHRILAAPQTAGASAVQQLAWPYWERSSRRERETILDAVFKQFGESRLQWTDMNTNYNFTNSLIFKLIQYFCSYYMVIENVTPSEWCAEIPPKIPHKAYSHCTSPMILDSSSDIFNLLTKWNALFLV